MMCDRRMCEDLAGAQSLGEDMVAGWIRLLGEGHPSELNAKANLAAQDRMRQLAAKPGMIIPGHDPEVFVKFPKPGNGVARLD